jgi:hypothetical protein
MKVPFPAAHLSRSALSHRPGEDRVVQMDENHGPLLSGIDVDPNPLFA